MTRIHAEGDEQLVRGEAEHHLSDRLRLDLTSQQFDWHNGTFQGDDDAPLWLQLFLHLVLCFATLIIPLLLYSYDAVAKPYSLMASEPPVQAHLPLEIIRWIIFLAMAYLGFVLTNLIAIGITYAVYCYYRIRGREVTGKMQNLINHMLFLRVYVARFVASLVLLFTAFALFPLSINEQNMVFFDFGGKGRKEANVEETDQVMSGLAFADVFRKYSSGHSVQFFVNRAAASVFVLCGLVLVEKIIVQKIAATFHYRAFGKRIEDNKFGIKMTKKLRAMVLRHGSATTEADLATVVFQGVCPQNRTAITVADIALFTLAADAERYFHLIDLEATGEMSRDQYIRSINRLLHEQESLRLAVLDQNHVVRKLDKLFLVFTTILVAISWMSLFQVSTQTVLAALGGIGVILTIASMGTVKTAFESIIFVIFTHPFDVGDRVIIRNDQYIVRELGLWSSTFEGPGNRLTYIANSRLRAEMIINTRRSPFQSEVVKFSILPSTPTDAIRALEARLLSFLRQNPKDYVPKVVVGGFQITDKESMHMVVPIFHRGNFQDEELKDLRTRNFVLYLKETLTECGITLSPPIYSMH
jgi:small-conductance mechanosensitive channel